MPTRHYSSTAPASARTLQNQRCETVAIWVLDAATTQFLERLLNRDFRVVVYLDGDQRRMKRTPLKIAASQTPRRVVDAGTLRRRLFRNTKAGRRPAAAGSSFKSLRGLLEASRRAQTPETDPPPVFGRSRPATSHRRLPPESPDHRQRLGLFRVPGRAVHVEFEHASRIGEAQVPVWTCPSRSCISLNLSEALFVEFVEFALGNDYTSHLALDVPKRQKNFWSFSRPTTGAGPRFDTIFEGVI